MQRRKRVIVGIFALVACCAVGAMAAEESASDLSEITTWELVKKGGWLMVPIGLCSLITMAYAAERFVNLRRARIMPPDLAGTLEDRLQTRDFAGARQICGDTDCALSRIIRAGLREMKYDWVRVEKAIEDTGAREIAVMRQNVRPLKVVSEIAPLLGLLGTIQGMMGAFQKVSSMGVGRKTEAFAGDIFLALVTTAAGLTVAIPALFLFYYFAGRIERHVLAMDNASAELLQSVREELEDDDSTETS